MEDYTPMLFNLVVVMYILGVLVSAALFFMIMRNPQKILNKVVNLSEKNCLLIIIANSIALAFINTIVEEYLFMIGILTLLISAVVRAKCKKINGYNRVAGGL